MLFRRTIGNGVIYTCATLPDGRYISPPAHPLFLPLLVNMSLEAGARERAANVELGMPLVLSGLKYERVGELEVQKPSGARYRVKADEAKLARRFVFEQTEEPGAYIWRRPEAPEPLAIGNVQLPAAESELVYRSVDSLIRRGTNSLVVGSVEELNAAMARLSEPEPRWTWPIAIVVMLFCVEALMGSRARTALRRQR